MSFLTRIMAFAMLAIWLSAASACVRECASFSDNDLCCPTESGGHEHSPSEADKTCVLSSALTKVYDDEQENATAKIALLPVAAFETAVIVQPSERSAEAFINDSAECLAPQWQFITRTALPARAPSSLS